METEAKKIRVKVKPKLVHKRLSERLQKLSQNGVQRFYYHYLVPGFNMSVEEIKPENLVVTTTVQCSIPRSLCVSSYTMDKIDLCHRRVAVHHRFMYRMRYNSGVFESYSKNKNFRKAMKSCIYPPSVVRAINLINVNPYPYFSGEYDWYFTGGNLACSENLLFRAYGENMDILNISSIKSKRLKNILNIDSDQAQTSEILEIQVLNDLKNRFVVRYENNLLKYFYDGYESQLLYNIEKQEVPFITFSESPLNENLLITGDLNKQVFLWDVSNSTKTPHSKIISQKTEIFGRADNWNCIRHLKNHSFVFADFEKLTLIDDRTQTLVNEMNFAFLKEEISTCEKISSVAISTKYRNLIYVGTTHKLFAIDARYLKNRSKKLMLLKWTHQMNYPPIILKTHDCDDFELIAASSPLSGEIRLFEVKSTQNENSERIYTSPYLPISPPEFLKSFNLAKLHGECLSPLVNLESRIKKCTTGLDFFEKNNKLQLIIMNSLGDIFASKITINEEIEYTKKYHTNVVQNYYNAVQDMSYKNQKQLHVTDLQNMNKISKILRCNRLSSKEDFRISENEKEVDEFLVSDFRTIKRKLSKWEKTPAQYAQCKDMLASNLLQIWEFDTNKVDEFGEILSSITKQNTQESNQSRIQNWIEDIEKNYKDIQFDDNYMTENKNCNEYTEVNQNESQQTVSHNNINMSLLDEQSIDNILLKDFSNKTLNAIPNYTLTISNQVNNDEINNISNNGLENATQNIDCLIRHSNIINDSKKLSINKKKQRYVKGF